MLNRRNFLISMSCALVLSSFSVLSSENRRVSKVDIGMSPQRIRAIVSAGGVILFNKGTYRVGELKPPSNCILSGGGQLTYTEGKGWDEEGTLLVGGVNCSNSTNVTVKDLTIDSFDSKGNALCGMTPRTGNILIERVTTRANNHGQLWEANDSNPQNNNAIGNITAKDCVHYHGPNGFVTKHKNVSFINCKAIDVDVQAFVVASDNINLNGRYSRATGTKIISGKVYCKPGSSALRIYSRTYESNINVLGVDGVKILDFYASGEKSKLFYIGDAAGRNGRGKREYIPLISQNVYIECNSQVDVNKLKMRVAFCENVIVKAPTIGTTIEKGDEISKLKTI